jgi:hypothetical protein
MTQIISCKLQQGTRSYHILQDAGKFGRHESYLANCNKGQKATACFRKQYFVDGGVVSFPERVNTIMKDQTGHLAHDLHVAQMGLDEAI